MLYSLIFLLLLFLIYIIKYAKRIKKGFIFGIIGGCGLGNKIAAVPGTYLLSVLSNRNFHSIIIYNFDSNW